MPNLPTPHVCELPRTPLDPAQALAKLCLQVQARRLSGQPLAQRDQAQRDQALRDQALRDQALRDQALRAADLWRQAARQHATAPAQGRANAPWDQWGQHLEACVEGMPRTDSEVLLEEAASGINRETAQLACILQVAGQLAAWSVGCRGPAIWRAGWHYGRLVSSGELKGWRGSVIQALESLGPEGQACLAAGQLSDLS